MHEFDALMRDWTYKLEVSADVAQVRTLDLLVFSAKLNINTYFFFFFN